MVTRHVVQHGVVGNLKDIVLQLLQRRYAKYLFFGLWVTEDKITEAHMLFYEPVEIDVHLRRVLVDKVEAFSLCLGLIKGLRRIENQRHILVATANLAQQLKTGLRVAFLHMTESARHRLHRESGIRNVTLTGGEPLIQPDIEKLIDRLLSDESLRIEIETNGAVDIRPFMRDEERLSFTVDYKCPGSERRRICRT